MDERVGDRLLKAAASGCVEVLDQADWKLGLLGPCHLSSATAAQRLLDFLEDGLLEPCDLQWRQQAVERLGRGVEDHLGVVQFDAAVVAVQAQKGVTGDSRYVEASKRSQHGWQAVPGLNGEFVDLCSKVGVQAAYLGCAGKSLQQPRSILAERLHTGRRCAVTVELPRDPAQGCAAHPLDQAPGLQQRSRLH